jgi:T5SS/PEP-CTERM-associated repeat protein
MKWLQRVGLRYFLFVATMVVVVAVMPAEVATAVTKNWVGGIGNWSPGSWSPAGVPAPGDTVNIVHTDGTTRTVTLNVDTPSLGLVSINLTGGIGTTFASLAINSDSDLTANGIFVGGYNGTGVSNGRGALSQSAGTVTTSSGTDLGIGHGAGSTGVYTLTGVAVVANQSEYIGVSGTGTFNHSGGTNRINASTVGQLILGVNAGSSGTYNLSGPFSTNLFSESTEFIGYNGTATFNQTGGVHTVINDLYLGNGASGVGTYTISAGQTNASNVFVGNAGTGTLTIQGTGVMNIFGLSINGTSNVNVNGGTLRLDTIPISSISRFHFNSGKVSLSGDRHMSADIVASQLFGFGQLTAGKHGEVRGIASFDGEFELKDGGMFTSENGRIGVSQFAPAVVNVSGPGTAWFLTNTTESLIIAYPQSFGAELNITNGALVDANTVVNRAKGVINLDGGTLRCVLVDAGFDGEGVINFYSGTLQLIGARAIGTDTTIEKFLGAAPTLTSGKELSVEGIATLMTTVTLDDGTLTAASIVNGQNLRLQRGTLNITNQAVTIQLGGLLGSTLDLNDDMTVNVNAGITNQGLVTGDGQIGGSFTNAATGELRGEPGKSLKLTGGAGATNNFGRINLYGGMIEIAANVFNNAGAFISGNGTLKAGTLFNSGTMNFAGTANILGTVVNNAGGKVISGGGGATIFYGDVTNNGEVRTATNGFTVFFGSVSGSGTFTGTGTVNFEGDLSPGSSPGNVSFAGDVVLGAATALQIEIGGLTPGTQHDKLTVAGDLALDGALTVSLFNNFVPGAGQSFNILDWGTLTGTFDAIDLPTLTGLTWNTSQLYATGVLSVAAAGIPGDYNNNGTVDAGDYILWRKGGPLQNEVDNPGTVNAQDYVEWKARFGNTGSGSGSIGGSSAQAAVPEPVSTSLLIFGIALMYWKRRRIESRLSSTH